MKKRALAIALSLALLLSVFVPGTLAMGTTETETDTTTVVSQSDTEVLAEDGEGTLSGDGQSVVTDGDTVTGDGQTTDEGTVTGDGQTADEGTVTGDGQTTGEGTVTGDGQTTDQGAVTGDGQTTDQGTVTGDGQTTEEGTVTGDGQTAGEGTVTDDGQTVDEGNVTGDGQTADPTEATAATDPTVAADPTETTAATDPTDPVCTCPGTEEEKAAEGFVHQEGCPYYVETAPAMPQLMMMIAADIRAGGSETIESKWFTFTGVEEPDSFLGVDEGEITADKVPSIDGYTFVGAYVENIPVVRIGQIDFEGKTYVYYTTEGSSDVAALILGDGMKITLQYKLNPVPINYSVTVNGDDSPNLTANGVPYGGDQKVDVKVIPDANPKEVFPGDSYTFTVEIPRGYTATVSVNGAKQPQELGKSPKYELLEDLSTVVRTGELARYQAQYTVSAAETNNVAVALTPSSYTFSHEEMSGSRYFKDENVPRATYPDGLIPTIGKDGSLTWRMYANSGWILNKMEINETKISVPFANETVETILPSGTRVALTRVTRGGAYQYTFRFSNCYENLVVTSGNLNGTSWEEYMPYTYVGVESAEYYKDGNWVEMKIGQPVAKDTLETEQSSSEENGNKRTDTEKYTAQIRVKLLPGYGNPVLTINGKEIHLNLDGEWYVSDSTVVYVVEKYYKWHEGIFGWGGRWEPDGSEESDCGFEEYTRLIEIKAQPINVNVEYAGGAVENPDGLPTDDSTYNLTTKPNVLIPLAIPKDRTNQMVFTGWENGGKNYLPNQLVPLSELSIENGKAVFTAQWVNVENAQQINFTIQIKDGDKVLGEIPSSAPKDAPIILDVYSTTIQDWLAAHPEYDLAENNQLYYKSIENNQKVVLNVVEKAVTIQYKVVGPDDCGAVAPATETVKVQSGTPYGSVPTPNSGFRFVGWFTDEGCTIPAYEVGEDNRLTPQRTGSLWTEATYYAKFEHATADLTIFANGLDGTYETQGTIYKVTVDAEDDKSDKIFYVSINGNNSTTIENLPYGEYIVEPMNSWSWRYSAGSQGPVTPEANDDGEMVASVTVTFSGPSTKWLSGNDYFACN